MTVSYTRRQRTSTARYCSRSIFPSEAFSISVSLDGSDGGYLLSLGWLSVVLEVFQVFFSSGLS